MKYSIRFARSVRALSADVPAEESAVRPLVIEAGFAEVAAIEGSTKSASIRAVTDRASSSRTTRSALGLENRASSCVMTDRAATLWYGRVTAPITPFDTGFPRPSPTQ